jgi:hypothetical protein
MGYDSPFIAAKINALSEITGMTVPIQMQPGGSMAVLQPPRSRFMINDILGGGGKLRSETDDDDRTLSPQPRDLSIPPNTMWHHQNDESDDDQSDSSMIDDHSICSGNYHEITINLKLFDIRNGKEWNCVTIWRR